MKKIVFFMLFIFTLTAKSDDYQELRDMSKAVTITHYHDILKTFQGTFRQIYFYTPPESKMEQGSGKSVNNIILSDRFLEINSRLEFGKDSVVKKMIIGYDGIAGKYFITQYSNFETFPITAFGDFDAATKSIVFWGYYTHKDLNPAKIKVVLKSVSIEEFNYLFYEISDGKEVKILEIKNYKLGD